VSGPIFDFSDTWQLVINTTTTIITFLMVFLIQNTQNRDALAMHLKLDELIHSIETADDRIIRAEDETDEELADLKRKYEGLLDEHTALRARLDQSTASG
jgi:low affinity Fe/Cu permease